MTFDQRSVDQVFGEQRRDHDDAVAISDLQALVAQLESSAGSGLSSSASAAIAARLGAECRRVRQRRWRWAAAIIVALTLFLPASAAVWHAITRARAPVPMPVSSAPSAADPRAEPPSPSAPEPNAVRETVPPPVTDHVRVSGRVVDEAGLPISRPEIYWSAANVRVGANATGNDDGTFDLRDVPRGAEMFLVISRAGYVATHRSVLPEAPFRVDEDFVVPDVVLRRGLAWTATVVDLEGQGIDGVQVYSAHEPPDLDDPYQQQSLRAYGGWAVTGVDGQLAIWGRPRKPDAADQILLMKSGYASAKYLFVEGARLVMGRAPVVAISVSGATGASHLTVERFEWMYGDDQLNPRRVEREVEVDANAVTEVPLDFAPCKYRLRLTSPARAPVERVIESRPGEHTPWSIALQPGHVVSGHVVAASTREPLVGARVILLEDRSTDAFRERLNASAEYADRPFTLTDPDGHFALGSERKWVNLLIRAEGFALVCLLGVDLEDLTRELLIPMGRGARLVVRVLDDDGNPLPQPHAQLRALTMLPVAVDGLVTLDHAEIADPYPWAKYDLDLRGEAGTIDRSGIPAGEYVLEYPGGVRRLSLRDDDVVTLTFPESSARHDVRGSASCDGEPLAGGLIRVTPCARGASSSAVVKIDAHGHFTIDGLTAGQYQLAFAHPRLESPHWSGTERVQGKCLVDVPLGDGVALDLQFARVALEADVRDAETHAPIAGADVDLVYLGLLRVGGDGKLALPPADDPRHIPCSGRDTDALGRVVLGARPATRFVVRARAVGYEVAQQEMTPPFGDTLQVAFRLQRATRTLRLLLPVPDAQDFQGTPMIPFSASVESAGLRVGIAPQMLRVDGGLELRGMPAGPVAVTLVPLAVEWREPMPAARVFTLEMPESGVVEREITPLVAGHVNVIVDEGAVVSVEDAAGQHWQQSAIWRYVDEGSPGASLDPGIRRFEAIASGPASVHVVHRDGSVTDQSIVVPAGQWAMVVATGR